ncbi:MAG: Flp pilus assembly protein CpaB [Acidimicrobiia bacterium]|nr:Flp pilus assembly protein CpaB [Acidimicrobiia bacterium]
MGNRRVMVAVLAVALAVFAGVATFVYVEGADERAEEKVDTVEAFVAGVDIPRNTTGDDAVARGMVVKQEVLRESVPPGAVATTDVLLGREAAGPIGKGQFIVDSSFVSAVEARPLTELLQEHETQAIAISVDATKGVGNLLQPGDRVNMIVFLGGTTQFMLQNVPVLQANGRLQGEVPATQAVAAADGAAAPTGMASAGGGILVLEVDALQAAQVVQASQTGTIYLTLVPPEYSPVATPVVTGENLFAPESPAPAPEGEQ